MSLVSVHNCTHSLCLTIWILQALQDYTKAISLNLAFQDPLLTAAGAWACQTTCTMITDMAVIQVEMREAGQVLFLMGKHTC